MGFAMFFGYHSFVWNDKDIEIKFKTRFKKEKYLQSMFSCIILVITIQLFHCNVVNEGLKN